MVIQESPTFQKNPEKPPKKHEQPDQPEQTAEQYARQAEQQVESFKQNIPPNVDPDTNQSLQDLNDRADDALNRFYKSLRAKVRYTPKGLEKSMPAEKKGGIKPETLQSMAKERARGLKKIQKVIEEMQKEQEKALQYFYQRTERFYNDLTKSISDHDFRQKADKLTNYINKIMSKQFAESAYDLSEEQINALKEVRKIISGENKENVRKKLAELLGKTEAA